MYHFSISYATPCHLKQRSILFCQIVGQYINRLRLNAVYLISNGPLCLIVMKIVAKLPLEVDNSY